MAHAATWGLSRSTLLSLWWSVVAGVGACVRELHRRRAPPPPLLRHTHPWAGVQLDPPCATPQPAGRGAGRSLGAASSQVRLQRPSEQVRAPAGRYASMAQQAWADEGGAEDQTLLVARSLAVPTHLQVVAPVPAGSAAADARKDLGSPRGLFNCWSGRRHRAHRQRRISLVSRASAEDVLSLVVPIQAVPAFVHAYPMRGAAIRAEPGVAAVP